MIKERFHHTQKTMQKLKNWRCKQSKLVVEIILHLFFWIIVCFFFLLFSVNTFRYLEGIICFSFTVIAVYVCYFLLYRILHKKGGSILFWCSMTVIIALFSTFEVVLIHTQALRIVNEFELKYVNPYLTGIYWSIAMRYAFFILLFTVLRFYQEVEKTILMNKKAHASELLSYLYSRVLPHYLVGVINDLQAMAITSSDRLPELLDKLNMLLHYIMTKAVKEKVLLKEEISFYRNYIELEMLRYTNPIEVIFENHNLKEEVEIAPLLLENIISNAFKYTCHDGTGYVKMTLTQNTENILTFECENNVSQDIPHISYGEGLDNLLNRLNLLYHNRCNFKFENENSICKITLQLSL